MEEKNQIEETMSSSENHRAELRERIERILGKIEEMESE
jgi:hypothetical protein